MSAHQLSVVIIGAGIGGLTAGAYLAQKGHKVIVFEMAKTVGGSASWYTRRNMTFPTGATIAFGLEEGGLWRELLDELGVRVDAKLLEQPMNIVLSGDRQLALLREAKAWERQLLETFPERNFYVLKFWKDIQRISAAVQAVTRARLSLPLQSWADVKRLLRFAALNPRAAWTVARYGLYKVEGLLRKHKLADYKPFREFLNAQLLDAVQVEGGKAALLPAALALDIYRLGSYAVEGGRGIGEISVQLANRITALQGEVLLSDPVEQVRFDKATQKWFVGSTKKLAQADIVIDNSGSKLMESFYRKRTFTSPKIRWGAARMDAVLKADVLHELPEAAATNGLPFALQIIPSEENAIIFGDLHGPVYATFHVARDREQRVIDGQVVMTVSVHTEPERWLWYEQAEYEARKKLIASAMFEEISRIVDVEKHVISYEMGTPRTYKKFEGKSIVGGNPLTVLQGMLRPDGVKTSHPGLYRVGEHVFPGPGTLSASLSGMFAARAIEEKYMKRGNEQL